MSNVSYPVQASLRNGHLHIQGASLPINRHYGFATNITVPEAFVGWFNQQGASEKSMASEKRDYLRGVVYISGENHPVLVFGGTKLNDENGARLTVNNDPEDLLRRFTQVATPIQNWSANTDASL